MSWDADFGGLPPIELPDGGELATLADCRAYVLELPKLEQQAQQWQHATEALLKAAKHGGPFLMIARIAVSRALQGARGVDPLPPLKVAKQDRWKERRKKR
jgi:hypothetical protein